ncbi:bifunctional diguanylate cyclase/phosphodiesterase [Pararhodospirillum photometricum]|uniref:Diguanylate cyclase/phosphodiesterase n=1 Tax=Pararhodospirillum photometricum DSM 122 TaxID=1150469 RepID=H6SN31_PARPM|nr:bifunctional diguanylate cyclase/phosphodiesterase [Pararhodospirillum photometricum]CCG06907.1 Diguanylate cyclase/phosphodiesterase [Pararhodospirillum photometricum DSM 122]
MNETKQDPLGRRGDPVKTGSGRTGWFGPLLSPPRPGPTPPACLETPTPPPGRRDWSALLDSLDIALQPVVSLSSGRAVGFEALIRGAEGFADARELFDEAWRIAVLEGSPALPRELELHAWDVAMARFGTLTPDQRGDARLYLNLDPRLLPQADALASALDTLRQRHGLPAVSLALEISERLPMPDYGAVEATLDRVGALIHRLRPRVGKVALDDFGVGFASLPLLRSVKPDLVKIDRFFVQGTAHDQARKLFLSNMANVCRLMGIQIVAKGVETLEDFHGARDAGCDQAQGCLLACPETDSTRLQGYYPLVLEINAAEQRRLGGDQHLVAAQISTLAPLVCPSPMAVVFERFRQEKSRTFFPVVDATGDPLGIVREVDLKDYTYSLYGKELINNKSLGLGLQDFITRCPTVDITTRAEKILEAFSANSRTEGLIITEDGRYRGFLTASSLLRIINEKNLAAARDQNPLTRLAGNAAINTFLGEALAETDTSLSLAYIDFDNFKPFNDKYGFRQGDRAILLFADLMRTRLDTEGMFMGHIGGDDFFAAFRGLEESAAEAHVRALTAKFESDVASFYDEATRLQGHIIARDRHGIERQMPLLGASAAVVHLPPGHATRDIDAISGLIAALKKEAKLSPDRLAVATVTLRP